MVLKTFQATSETKTIEEDVCIRRFLLFHKIRVLKRGVIIPDNFIAELEDFSLRNSLPELKNKRIQCCDLCLKAHALKNAQKFGLDKKAASVISSILEGDSSGHNGYYLDNGELVKILE